MQVSGNEEQGRFTGKLVYWGAQILNAPLTLAANWVTIPASKTSTTPSQTSSQPIALGYSMSKEWQIGVVKGVAEQILPAAENREKEKLESLIGKTSGLFNFIKKFIIPSILKFLPEVLKEKSIEKELLQGINTIIYKGTYNLLVNGMVDVLNESRSVNTFIKKLAPTLTDAEVSKIERNLRPFLDGCSSDPQRFMQLERGLKFVELGKSIDVDLLLVRSIARFGRVLTDRFAMLKLELKLKTSVEDQNKAIETAIRDILVLLFPGGLAAEVSELTTFSFVGIKLESEIVSRAADFLRPHLMAEVAMNRVVDPTHAEKSKKFSRYMLSLVMREPKLLDEFQDKNNELHGVIFPWLKNFLPKLMEGGREEAACDFIAPFVMRFLEMRLGVGKDANTPAGAVASLALNVLRVVKTQNNSDRMATALHKALFPSGTKNFSEGILPGFVPSVAVAKQVDGVVEPLLKKWAESLVNWKQGVQPGLLAKNLATIATKSFGEMLARDVVRRAKISDVVHAAILKKAPNAKEFANDVRDLSNAVLAQAGTPSFEANLQPILEIVFEKLIRRAAMRTGDDPAKFLGKLIDEVVKIIESKDPFSDIRLKGLLYSVVLPEHIKDDLSSILPDELAKIIPEDALLAVIDDGFNTVAEHLAAWGNDAVASKAQAPELTFLLDPLMGEFKTSTDALAQLAFNRAKSAMPASTQPVLTAHEQHIKTTLSSLLALLGDSKAKFFVEGLLVKVIAKKCPTKEAFDALLTTLGTAFAEEFPLIVNGKNADELVQKLLLALFPLGIDTEIQAYLPGMLGKFAAEWVKTDLSPLLTPLIQGFKQQGTLTPQEMELAKQTGAFTAKFVEAMYTRGAQSEIDEMLAGIIPNADDRKNLAPFLILLVQNPGMKETLSKVVACVVENALKGVKESLKDPKLNKKLKAAMLDVVMDQAFWTLEGSNVDKRVIDGNKAVETLLGISGLSQALSEGPIRDGVAKLLKTVLTSSLNTVNEKRIRTKILYNIAKQLNKVSIPKDKIEAVANVCPEGLKGDMNSLRTFIDEVLSNNNDEERKNALAAFQKRLPDAEKNSAQKVFDLAVTVRSGGTPSDAPLVRALKTAWNARDLAPQNTQDDPLVVLYNKLSGDTRLQMPILKQQIQYLIDQPYAPLPKSLSGHEELVRDIIFEEKLQIKCDRLVGEIARQMDPTLAKAALSLGRSSLASIISKELRFQLSQDLFKLLEPGFEAGAENMRLMDHADTDAKEAADKAAGKAREQVEERLTKVHLKEGIKGKSHAAFKLLFEKLDYALETGIGAIFGSTIGNPIGYVAASILFFPALPLQKFIDALIDWEIDRDVNQIQGVLDNDKITRFIAKTVDGVVDRIS